jgi:hypothetical protein
MAKNKNHKVDDRRQIGLFKELLSVIFDIEEKTMDRIIAVLENSADISDVKTHIVRNHAGARAIKYLRLAIEYARHEGSIKHETEKDEFDPQHMQDVESSAYQERPHREQEPQPEIENKESKMEHKSIKEATFKDYLMELVVSDDPMQAMQDVKRAARNPDRYIKEQMRSTVDQQREIQKSDDPNKTEKMRLAKLKQQMQMQQKKIENKEKQAEREAGIKTDTGERPVSGMAST